MQTFLFSTHCITSIQRELSQSLLQLLSRSYSVDIIDNNRFSSAGCTLLTEIPVDKQYDLIFAFTRKGFQRIKRYAKNNRIPVVYVIDRHESEKEFVHDVSISCFLVINDGDVLKPILFPEDCSVQIGYPFIGNGSSFKEKQPAAPSILVITDQQTLLKIIPILNNHGEYSFTIVCNRPRAIRTLLNANCEAIPITGCKIEEKIQNSSLVIGCGVPVLKSIACRKQVIVAGWYGFGRRVTADTIEGHYNVLFRGRPGAVGEEIIPFNLLSHEIAACMNQSASDRQAESRQLSSWIVEKQQQIAVQVDKAIALAISSKMVRDVPYKWSSIYSFIAVDDTSYLVINRRWMKIETVMDAADYRLLQLFKTGSTPNSVQSQVTGKTPSQWNKFMGYLVDYKFILPYASPANL